jgi:hypothetical protein
MRYTLFVDFYLFFYVFMTVILLFFFFLCNAIFVVINVILFNRLLHFHIRHIIFSRLSYLLFDVF